MASASRSTSADAKKEQKMSFAKIAATGIKPLNAQQNSRNVLNNNQNNLVPSPPSDGAAIVTPSISNDQLPVALKQKALVQLASKDVETTESVQTGTNGPKVRVQIVESVPQRLGEPGSEGLLAPTSDDVGTQVSSSSGSNKPQSLDGKSVASGTTFALDEKDSLRPDDSASVKAVDEDDMFAPSTSGLPGSRIGSDDGARAFRDQLREISSMEPRRRGAPQQVYDDSPKGVLYVPPSGPGIGAIPNSARPGAVSTPNADVLPDQKLLEALENPRDRVWVLKLEQDVIDFVKDPKESALTLPQCHSFYRLLAHKMADYYMLGHHVEDSSPAVRLYKTPNCRIPPPLTGIMTPSTAASTPPPSAPQMKILRRGLDRSGLDANGSKIPSKSGSENGESGNEDDKKAKAPVTREEREARYEAARLRIMGSAKPTDSPEAPKEKQESRSSSATGRKSKKKQRADSDDGFEARSAYSNFYTTSFSSEGISATAYAYPEHSEGAGTQYASAYSVQNQNNGMSQLPLQSSTSPHWPQQAYQNVDSTQAWAQSQSGTYDLTADFQRSMTFHNQIPSPSQNLSFNANYRQHYYGPQQGWPQQQYQAPGQINPIGYGLTQPYTALTSPGQLDQPYAYGQLPSEAFPGRPASKTEHPLPGSYKGKNFNPQSQAFVPGQASGRTFAAQNTPAAPAMYSSGFADSAQLQRQNSAQSHGSGFASPHHGSPHIAPHHASSQSMSQPMTHPLPQGPVYPRQPSPSLPLPPKPGIVPQPGVSLGFNMQHPQQSQSLLAKWGTPASLPAKPPLPAESFDGSKVAQVQRQPYTSAAAVARQPSGGYPSFGSMPPAGSAQVVNGSGVQAVRRT